MAPERVDRLVDRYFPVLAFVIAFVFVGLHVSAFTELSPYDEATHADYALHASRGSLPVTGDDLDQEILREWSCRGNFDHDELPACESTSFDPSVYFAEGTNYNGQHPPAYYIVAGSYARVATDVFGVDSFLGAARSFGALTLALGVIILYRAMRVLDISPAAAGGAALLLLAVPQFIHMHSTVNNDAALVLIASTTLLAGVRVYRDEWPAWTLPAIGLVAGLTKLTASFPVATMGLALFAIGLAMRSEQRARARRFMRIGSATVVTAVMLPVFWALFDRTRRAPDWENPLSGLSTRDVVGNPFTEIFTDMFAMIPPLTQIYVAPAARVDHLSEWIKFSGWILLIGIFGILFQQCRAYRLFGLTQLLVLLAIPPAIQSLAVVSGQEYFLQVSPRYGLAMAPGALFTLAVVLDQRRFTRLVLPAVAAVGLVIIGGGMV